MSIKICSQKTLVLLILAVFMLTQIMGITPLYADEPTYKKMAENKRFVLYVNSKYGYIKLIDKLTQTTWYSNPENWRDDPVAAGSMRTQLASQLVIKYAFMESYSTQTANSYAGSAMKKGLKIKKVKSGYIASYYFKKEGFEIPIEVVLGDDYVDVNLLVGQIKESKTDKYRLVSVQLLPFFGAGSSKDTGYIVVPDGCGAVINFNNKKGNEEYSQRVYGPDYAFVREPNVYVTQYARLPVYGIKKNDVGLLAVATKGDAKAIVNAYTSGSRNSYNQAYFEFIVREQDSVTFRERQWNEETFNVFEESIPKYKKYTVRYYFLEKGKSDYVAMADKFREYLVKEKGLKKNLASDIPFYVELYGAIKKVKYIVGIPRNVTIPLTTFSDAQQIVKELKKLGINDIVIKYTGWYQNGIYFDIPFNLKPEGVLGGKRELENLMNYLRRNSIKAYLDLDFVTFRKGSIFHPINVVATKSMKKTPVKLIRYSPATCYADDDYPVLFAATPSYVSEFIKRFVTYGKDYTSSVSLTTLSKMLYSDFGARKVNRLQTKEIFERETAELKKRFLSVMLSEPNEFLLPFANEVVDIPLQSSRFAIEDYEIPFYQMVLRGYIPYSAPSINYFTADWYWKLKMIESGSYLKFTWTARNEDKLKETLCDYLYSSNYKKWLSDAGKLYRELYPILRLINNKKMIQHNVVVNGVVKVEYEGGIKIVLNYTNKTQSIDGIEFMPRSYKIIK